MTEPDPYHTVISLCVATRGRPEQLQAMWTSALDTATHPELVQLCIRIDEDDPSMVRPAPSGSGKLVGVHPPTGGALPVYWHCGPRGNLSACWNEALVGAEGGILWHGNDDVLFRTQRWDQNIRDAFRAIPDRIGCVHGRDGIHNQHQATLGFYSREWVDTLGYLIPPYFSCDWGDTWLSWCADQIGRRVFLDDVYTEHMHPAAGKAPVDQTHQERMARGAADQVDALYQRLEPERQADVAKLRQAIAAADRWVQ